MTRREMLAGLAAASPARGEEKPLRNLGGARAGFGIVVRAKGGRAGFDFLEYFHGLGLGVAELGVVTPGEARGVRRKVEDWGMRVLTDLPLPKDASAIAEYEALVKASKDAGAIGSRAALTARRYEAFDSYAAWRAEFERRQKQVELAEPVLRKYRLPLYLENHKGWRSAEQAAWMKRLGSEWVGVHFDFGNNVSLCEDPMETLKILLPYTGACHIKDMAVEPYEEGFLLSEVPLGEGFLDLKGMVALLQQKDANMPLDLEMITRDPLKIPVLTKKYWATFDDQGSPLPGRDVARMLEIVRKNPPKKALPRTTGLSLDAQLRLEEECVRKSIEWAKVNLKVA
jgi:sugar phosphate isomerase/epimerase